MLMKGTMNQSLRFARGMLGYHIWWASPIFQQGNYFVTEHNSTGMLFGSVSLLSSDMKNALTRQATDGEAIVKQSKNHAPGLISLMYPKYEHVIIHFKPFTNVIFVSLFHWLMKYYIESKSIEALCSMLKQCCVLQFKVMRPSFLVILQVRQFPGNFVTLIS